MIIIYTYYYNYYATYINVTYIKYSVIFVVTHNSRSSLELTRSHDPGCYDQ